MKVLLTSILEGVESGRRLYFLNTHKNQGPMSEPYFANEAMKR